MEGSRKRMKTREYFFKRYLDCMPVSISFWRAFESERFSREKLESPVLDIGCGDGIFAKEVFDQTLDVGIDLSAIEVERARKRGAYKEVVCANATNLPFPDAKFNTVISNCVLEHIPPIEEALKEIGRVTRKDARFMFTVPSEYHDPSFFWGVVFRKIGLGFLGTAYVNFVNWMFNHYNINDHKVWEERLNRAGFKLESYEYIIPPKSMQHQERWFPISVWGKFWKALSGHWVFGPRFFIKWFAPIWFRKSLNLEDKVGICYFIIARKQ